MRLPWRACDDRGQGAGAPSLHDELRADSMVTSVEAEFEKTRRECLEALAADPDAKLGRRFRYALKTSMGPAAYVPDSRSRQGEATPGLLRRTRLLELSARKVLPIWEQIVGTGDPRNLLDLCAEAPDEARWQERQRRACSRPLGRELAPDGQAPRGAEPREAAPPAQELNGQSH